MNRRLVFPFLIPLAHPTAVLILARIEAANEQEFPLNDSHCKLFIGKPGKFSPLELCQVKLKDLATIISFALSSAIEKLLAIDDTMSSMETMGRLVHSFHKIGRTPLSG